MITNIINSHNEIAHFTDELGNTYQLPIIGFGLMINDNDSMLVSLVIHNGDLHPADFLEGFSHISNSGVNLH